jgi:shikimate kinase
MGSGKTTVGRLLAGQLGWHFTDLDTEIETRSQLSIPAIFEKFGEARFRELEHAELERALGAAAEGGFALVLALGGGTLTQPANLELLRGAGTVLVWLDCPVDDLLLRCARMTNRPLFRDEASFRRLHEERLPAYRLADFRVESSAEPRQVVERILALGIFERVRV